MLRQFIVTSCIAYLNQLKEIISGVQNITLTPLKLALINFSLTEREGPTGEYRPEVLGSTDRAELGPYRSDRGSTFPCTNRASEVSK